MKTLAFKEQTQFELFIKYTALTFALPYLLGPDYYTRMGFGEYSPFLPFIGLKQTPTLVELVRQNGTFWLKNLAMVAANVLIVFPTTRRAGGACLLAIALYNAVFSYSLSVMNDFFLIFGLGLVLFGRAQAGLLRAFLLGGFASALALSALQKLNGSYLSGVEFQVALRRLARPFASAVMADPSFAKIMAYGGLAAEALAALILVPSNAFALIGFTASQLFATLIFFQINLSHSIHWFFLGFAFLLQFPWARGRTFWLLLISPFVFKLAQRGALYLFYDPPERLQNILFTAFVLFSFSYFIIFLVLLLRGGYRTTPIARSSYKAAALAVTLCFVYAGALRVAGVAPPYGFSQYSGVDREQIYSIVYLWDKNAIHRTPLLNEYFLDLEILNSWHDMVFEMDNALVFASADAGRAQNVLERLCAARAQTEPLQYSLSRHTREALLNLIANSSLRADSGGPRESCPNSVRGDH